MKWVGVFWTCHWVMHLIKNTLQLWALGFFSFPPPLFHSSLFFSFSVPLSSVLSALFCFFLSLSWITKSIENKSPPSITLICFHTMFAPLYFSALLFPLPSKIYHLWVSYLLFWTAANTTHSVKVRLQLLDFSIVPSLPYPLCHCSTTAPAGRAGKSLPQEQFITAINVMCFTRMPSKFTLTPSCWSRNNCFFYSSIIYTLLGRCLYPAEISILKG